MSQDPNAKSDKSIMSAPNGTGWRPSSTSSQSDTSDSAQSPITSNEPLKQTKVITPQASDGMQTVGIEKTPEKDNQTPKDLIRRVLVTLLLGGVIIASILIALPGVYDLSHPREIQVRKGEFRSLPSFETYVLTGFSFIVIILSGIGLRRVWKAKAMRLRGEVRGIQERVEQHDGIGQISSRAPDIIWSFRVERYQNGNRLPPIPVEMRGGKFKGFVREGDTVEIYDPWREGETIRPKQIFNVTNNTKVSTGKSRLARGCAVLMVIWTVLICILMAIYFLFLFRIIR